MAARLTANQKITANDGTVKVSAKMSLPNSDYGGISLFAVRAGFQAISEGGNTYNPCIDNGDYGQYTTRLIAFGAKSTNGDDVAVYSTHNPGDGDFLRVHLRPGSGFMLSSPTHYVSQIEVNENTGITASGLDADKYSAIWAIG